MRPQSRSVKRAALGGALVVVVATLALVLLSGGTSEDGAEPLPPVDPTAAVLVDADANGAILLAGQDIIGTTSSGRTVWRRRVQKTDLLPFAVCTPRCPGAEVTFAQSGATPPDRPDGPRLVYAPGGGEPRTGSPRLRVDRPLLPGPVAARIVQRDVRQPPRLLLANGAAVSLMNSNVGVFFAPARSDALVLDGLGQRNARLLLLGGSPTGWLLRRRLAAPRAVQGACLTEDGTRLGVVGNGPPMRSNGTGQWVRVGPLGPDEANAGMCAIGAGVMSTAVVRSQDGDNQTLVAIHRAAKVRSFRLTGAFPAGMWVSARTGTTAILQGKTMRLIDAKGRRSTWTGVTAALAASPNRLRILRADRTTQVRPF